VKSSTAKKSVKVNDPENQGASSDTLEIKVNGKDVIKKGEEKPQEVNKPVEQPKPVE
jgi:hypothetical protein